MKYVWIEESPNTASDYGVAPPTKETASDRSVGSDGKTKEVGRLVGVRRSWRRRRVAEKCLTRPHAPALEMQPSTGKWRVAGAWMLFWCRCLHKSWRSPPGAPSGMVGVGKIGLRKSSPESSPENFAGGKIIYYKYIIFNIIDVNKIPLNAILVTALIDMYSKCRDVEKAWRISDGISCKKLPPWNAIIT
ncbi:hypothetical protein CK203_003169 [Vitis vinifera]|uniref:Uncharacterized protein n=1 Tax=Vitis vinifera TaxID=29760 RepID=A0A438K725_VITVI|nr:hypothetical protein CK203_003169 [Vitis vinifera]